MSEIEEFVHDLERRSPVFFVLNSTAKGSFLAVIVASLGNVSTLMDVPWLIVLIVLGFVVALHIALSLYAHNLWKKQR